MCLESNSGRPGQLTQLVYVSSANPAFDPLTLPELLVEFRRRNKQAHITGLLLFRTGTFFQILEGPKDQVEPLFERIGRDQRHGNVLSIHSQSTSYRIFPEWQMGFVADQKLIDSLDGFCDFFGNSDGLCKTFTDLAGEQRYIKQILNGFRRGRWARRPLVPAPTSLLLDQSTEASAT